MNDVHMPAAFNELFGEPARTLRQMTADEILTAIDWQTTTADRLEQECEPFVKLATAAVDGTLSPNTPVHMVTTAARRLREASEAQAKAMRLVTLVMGAVRAQWNAHPGLKLEDAVRLFWPHGRGAGQ
jgi:hypothetical protein